MIGAWNVLPRVVLVADTTRSTLVIMHVFIMDFGCSGESAPAVVRHYCLFKKEVMWEVIEIVKQLLRSTLVNYTLLNNVTNITYI